MEKINSIDLAPVTFFLTEHLRGPNWSRHFEKVVQEFYRKFLYIQISNDDFKAVPTDYIDTYWHTHILMTEKYSADCMHICGRVIHHDPLFGTRDSAEKKVYSISKKRTLAAFEDSFSIKRNQFPGHIGRG